MAGQPARLSAEQRLQLWAAFSRWAAVILSRAQLCHLLAEINHTKKKNRKRNQSLLSAEGPLVATGAEPITQLHQQPPAAGVTWINEVPVG